MTPSFPEEKEPPFLIKNGAPIFLKKGWSPMTMEKNIIMTLPNRNTLFVAVGYWQQSLYIHLIVPDSIASIQNDNVNLLMIWLLHL